MANEYLKRTPTSTGNRKVFTWSGWVKRNSLTDGAAQSLFTGGVNASDRGVIDFNDVDTLRFGFNNSASWSLTETTAKFRDAGSWMNVIVSVDLTTSGNEDVSIYVNGIKISSSAVTWPSIVNNVWNAAGYGTYITSTYGDLSAMYEGEMFDVFWIDGQALTPDVFGFYKVGKGYISAGSAQATDFRPGQWVPKTPRVIKTTINNNGGFGVNGFYLPMNDSNNFGADFHCDPNSIIKLQENLPQPRCRIDGVGDYTGALRDDPFKQYLVAAIPGVSGGLNDGFGDYSHIIRGNGTALSVATTNSPSISSDTSVYYGSSVKLIRSNSQDVVVTGFNNNIGTGDFTIEGWFRFDSRSEDFNAFNLNEGGTIKFFMQARIFGGPSDFHTRFVGTGNEYNSSAIGWNDSHLNNWYHYAVSRNSGTLRFFLNGVCVGVHLNHTENIGSVNTLRIGYMSGDGTKYLDGYFQDIRYYTVGKYTGGFDVPRPYTPVGIATWRAVPDTTANNFATLNPLDEADIGISAGNLSIDQSSGGWHTLLGTQYVSSGKWYAEMRIDRLGWIMFGTDQTWLQTSSKHIGGQTGSKGISLVYNTGSRGDITYNGTNSVYTGGDATAANGDIISIALDLDNNNVKFFKNNVQQYNLDNLLELGEQYSIGLSPYSNVAATINYGQNPTFSGNTTAGTFTDSNGKGLFKYQPPSGFLALCEDNLPTPAISDPGKYFKTVLWTGDGLNGRSITGIGFTPDLVWIKSRSNAYNHGLQDSVRGIGKVLYSNLTNTEDTGSVSLTSFASNGFGLGNDSWNGSGITYVAWCWKAGAGTTSTNTDGSITSVVSVNQDAGFSIVSYTGNGSAGTIGHGLGKTPAFVITKHRNLDTHWRIWHKSLTAYNYTLFFNTGAQQIQPAYSALPTSSVINLDSDLTGAYNFVTYCWSEIEGYSKFGSYIGNGSTDGRMVWCGFKPAWVMIKASSGTTNGWVIMDNARSSSNPSGQTIYAHNSNIETTDLNLREMDFVSNGFKIRAGGGTERNANGATYIFAAFAESPFQTANAK